MLSDCVSNVASRNELLIVQSGPLAEMARSARDRMTQAVLPAGESMIALAGAEIDEVLDDENCKHIISCLGVGICMVESEDFELHLDHLRYETIILVMDESPGGIYLREQVLAFFQRLMRPILEAGHVYGVATKLDLEMTEEDFARAVTASTTRKLIQVGLAGR